MSAAKDETAMLAQLGDAAAWALQRAVEAFGKQRPEDAALIIASLEAGQLRLRLTVESGGGQPARLVGSAIDPEGKIWELASMSVAQLHLN